MKRIATIFLGLIIAGVLFSPTAAEVPRLINYQGILTDSNGQPIDEPKDLTFTIYPDSAQGSVAIWTEEHALVPVNEGLFNVILGGIEAIPDSVFESADRWMGITVDSDPEIAPRMQITSVPWAFESTLADSSRKSDWFGLGNIPDGFADGIDNQGGAAGGGWFDDSTVVRLEDPADSVGIGTAMPTEKFQVVGSALIDSLLVKHIGAIRHAAQFPGEFASDRIAAAIADLPAEGGVVDATGLAGSQTLATNVFADAGNKSVTLILGPATYDVQAGQKYTGSGGVNIIGQGYGNTVLVAASSMDMITILPPTWGPRAHIADLGINIGSTNSTAIFLEGSVNHVVERVFFTCNTGSTVPVIKNIAYSVHIHDCTFVNGGRVIEFWSQSGFVDHCRFNNCDVSVWVRTNCISVTNCLFGEPMGRHAFFIDGAGYNCTFARNRCEGGVAEYVKIVGDAAWYPVRSLTIRENYFTQMNTPAIDGIYLKNVAGVSIESNWFAEGFPGTGASCVVFDGDVSDVVLSANTTNTDATMPGYEDVPLAVNNVTVTQSSLPGAFGGDLTVGGQISVSNLINLAPTLPPDDPVEGDVYMDETTHKLMVFDGTTWQGCW
ncbi:MAG: hypothetical protein KAW17_11620 [Candidatus Eisenbacteria sp.]|nr:hypothetical protein [Candidatus Eisenbacteria bacterium]